MANNFATTRISKLQLRGGALSASLAPSAREGFIVDAVRVRAWTVRKHRRNLCIVAFLARAISRTPGNALLITALVLASHSGTLRAQTGARAATQTETNVVYGMYSGLALLMDVYHPQSPNGYGVICIAGSGWHAPAQYNARQLKHDYWAQFLAAPLLRAGYTVFIINHRAAATFRYPAAVEDAQRVVRFVRRHARRFGISAERLGGIGESSGGHLAMMLGVLDGTGNPASPDSVEQQSAGLQAVVAYYGPSDLTGAFNSDYTASVVGSFIGRPRRPDTTSAEYAAYRAASPLAYVTSDDAPLLLVHGDQDPVVPISQSERMERAMRTARVPVKLIRIPGAGHGFEAKQEYPDFFTETVRWFDRYLRKSPPE